MERPRLDARGATLGDSRLNAFLASGYLYEIAGLAYYLLFLAMQRGRNRGRFSRRSLVLVMLAAIALVAIAPFHLAQSAVAITVALALAVAGLGSTFADTR